MLPQQNKAQQNRGYTSWNMLYKVNMLPEANENILG